MRARSPCRCSYPSCSCPSSCPQPPSMVFLSLPHVIIPLAILTLPFSNLSSCPDSSCRSYRFWLAPSFILIYVYIDVCAYTRLYTHALMEYTQYCTRAHVHFEPAWDLNGACEQAHLRATMCIGIRTCTHWRVDARTCMHGLRR